MNLLLALRKRRALKRYAKGLPHCLSRDYGPHEFFTRAQIDVAVAKLKLDREFIVYGYAMFLPADVFSGLVSGLPKPLSYVQARDEFRSYVRSHPSLQNDFYKSNNGGLGLSDGGP